MISLTRIHESHAPAGSAPDLGSARVFAVGTGEGASLARALAFGEKHLVLVRCCRGSLELAGRSVGVGQAFAWAPRCPVRVEGSPMQAIAVVAPTPAGGPVPAAARLYERGSAAARAFDDVAVAWLSGEAAALESRVAELLRFVRGEEGTGARRPGVRRDVAYGARAAMDGSIAAPLTIPQLADACATSPTVLKEAFREEFGLPVYEWYRRLRMLRASELLCAGEAAVGEVARAVGYSNASKFARAFSECMGASPSVYRQV